MTTDLQNPPHPLCQTSVPVLIPVSIDLQDVHKAKRIPQGHRLIETSQTFVMTLRIGHAYSI